MDLLANKTYILQATKLDIYEFETLSEEAIQNFIIELIQLGADCEFQRVFIKNFGPNKLQYYLFERDNDFQDFKFQLDPCDVENIDSINQEIKDIENDYLIENEVNNQFSMVVLNENINQYQLCIYQAIQKLLYYLGHTKMSMISSEQSMQFYMQNECQKKLCQETQKKHTLKYCFNKPLLKCQGNTTYYLPLPDNQQQDEDDAQQFFSVNQDYSDKFQFQTGNNQQDFQSD
ncbi:hypothetical protein ABPG74_009665 [Tetrahymena malaccensis]